MATTDYCFDLEDTPENILAIKIKEDIIDKLVACSSETEVKNVLNQVITDNYESLDIEQLRLGSASIGPVIDSFVACALDETSENLLDTQITVADLLKNAIDLLCDPPSFNIPAPFPIIDISAEFLKQLLIALLRLVMKIILSILKKLLQLILEICSGNYSFDGQSLLQAISDSVAGGINEGIDYINDTFAAFGIDANGVAATSIINGEGCQPPADVNTEVVKSSIDFMNDLSSVLTPVEICNFLENIPTEQSFQVVEELMKFEYPQMAAVFNSRTKIRSLFKTLGKRVDPKICKVIRDNAEKITSQPELCFTEDANEIRKALLKKRDLSDEEIENLLTKERERQTANLAQVADLLASIRTDPNKLLGGTPNIFCKGGSPGIITMEQMPSLQENLNSATNYVFNMYATTFMKELLTYQSALLSQQKTLNTTAPVLQKFVTLTIIDKDGALQVLENTINSVFSQKVAQGTYELCNKDGNTDIDSLINAYPGAVVQTAVDIQKVLNISNIVDLKDVIDADNVYILNYNTKQVIATELFDEQYGLINDGNVSTYKKTALGYRWLNDLISTNTSDMSISINLPTKFSLFNDTTTAPNYNIVPSSDNIVVNTHGTGIVLSASLNEFITTFTGSLSDYSIDRTGV